MIRSLMMIMAGHVVCMKKIKNAWLWLEKLKERELSAPTGTEV
jgi:hypothetical protein